MDMKERSERIFQELFEGARKPFNDVCLQVKNIPAGESLIKEVNIRYRPKTVRAIRIDSDHKVADLANPECEGVVRSSGWLIEGPNNVVFYLPVEQFREWFDIVKED